MPNPVLLLVTEPAASNQRVFKVSGGACSIGSAASASVRLETPGISTARIERRGESYYVLDGGGGQLRWNGLPFREARLFQGDVFKLGCVKIQFFIGDPVLEEAPVQLPADPASRPAPEADLDLDLDLDDELTSPAPLEAPPSPCDPPGASTPAQAYSSRLQDLERRLGGLVGELGIGRSPA